jgi:hypothetical protein
MHRRFLVGVPAVGLVGERNNRQYERVRERGLPGINHHLMNQKVEFPAVVTFHIGHDKVAVSVEAEMHAQVFFRIQKFGNSHYGLGPDGVFGFLADILHFHKCNLREFTTRHRSIFRFP